MSMPSSSRFLRLSRVALIVASAGLLAACQTPARNAAETAPDATVHVAQTERRDVAKGLYEIAYNTFDDKLYVAATPSFDATANGYLYRIDPVTLAIDDSIKLDRRAFALGVNAKTNTIFVGNTLDGSISLVDASTGASKGVIQVGAAEPKGGYEHTRKVLVDEVHNRLFVTSPSREGKVWIVDANTGTTLHTLENLGTWSTGAAYDAGNRRLYVGHGGSREIVVIDPDHGLIVTRFDTGEPESHYFINLALDVATQRLFAADANQGQLIVFDAIGGQILKRVPIGLGVLDIVFNPVLDEIYISNRGVSRSEPNGSGGITVIDASTYAVKRVFDAPVHPNSLALSPDGLSLYATIKAPHSDKHPAYNKDALDSVLHIDLR